MNIKVLMLVLLFSVPCLAADSGVKVLRSTPVPSESKTEKAFKSFFRSEIGYRIRGAVAGAVVGAIVGALGGSGIPVPMGPQCHPGDFLNGKNMREAALFVAAAGAFCGFVCAGDSSSSAL